VPDSMLPPDLGLTAAIRQHLLFRPTRAASMLGWVHADPSETVKASVGWHLEHPPEPAPDATRDDFAADDRALAEAVTPAPASD
jgi:hypothetical protein